MKKVVLIVILLFTILTVSASPIEFTNDTQLKLYTVDNDLFSEGQSIELYGLKTTSKPSIGFYSYDSASNQYRGVGWIVCHYNLSNGNTHQHCSIETLDNSTGVPTLNSHLEISYGSNITRPSIGFPGSDVIFSDFQKLFFGKAKSASVRYNPERNRVEYFSPEHRFLGGNIILVDKTLHLDGSGTETVRIDRGNTKSYGSAVWATNGSDIWAVQMRNDNTNDFYIRNTQIGKNIIKITNSSTLLATPVIFTPQTTAPLCTLESRGMIYFDDALNTHRACNGQEWTNLY